MSLNKLGDLAYLRGDVSASCDMYNKGLAVRRRIVGLQAGPESPDKARHLLDLANSLAKLGDAEQVWPALFCDWQPLTDSSLRVTAPRSLSAVCRRWATARMLQSCCRKLGASQHSCRARWTPRTRRSRPSCQRCSASWQGSDRGRLLSHSRRLLGSLRVCVCDSRCWVAV